MFAEDNRYEEYSAAMQEYYGDLGGRIAAQFKQEIRSDYAYYQIPFYQRVVNPSLGAIVHSTYVKNKLLHYNPAYHVELIPMGIIPPDLSQYDRTALREKFQLPQDSFIISSLGFIITGKRLRELLRAFALFVQDAPDALCLLVGKASPDFPIRELVQELNLKNNVIITGYVPYQSYLEYIALSDACVNLRYPTVRATSANILKIMALAKPVLVSDLCELLDIPDNCCMKIPLNEAEEANILQALHTLYHEPEQRNILGTQARNFVVEHHSMQQAADKYLAFCEKILAR
jgi:glycosyltransferase involved in cell wall biosynthesis